MCGRFVVYSAGAQLRDLLGITEVPEFTPSYNVAITDPAPVAHLDADDGRTISLMRWGLIPWWAKDDKIGHRCFNARAESAHEKPAFRDAFAKKRCLIPANGFFEWQRTGGKKKQPFYFHFADHRPFAFAGLWSRWRHGEEVVQSFTILTTQPNALVEPFHDRMPVILAPSDFDLWLDTTVVNPTCLEHLFDPFAASEMTTYPVDPIVNNVRSRGSQLIEAIVSPKQGVLF